MNPAKSVSSAAKLGSSAAINWSGWRDSWPTLAAESTSMTSLLRAMYTAQVSPTTLLRWHLLKGSGTLDYALEQTLLKLPPICT